MSLKAEQIAHINIVNWFNHNFPHLSGDLHHFANERKCSMNEGRTLKRMGVKKGVADFFLALPLNGKSGLWIELKVGNGKLSPEQIEFLDRKNKRGYVALVAWREEEAIESIITYLSSIPTNCFQNMPINCS